MSIDDENLELASRADTGDENAARVLIKRAMRLGFTVKEIDSYEFWIDLVLEFPTGEQ